VPLYEEEKEFTSLAIPISVKRENLARQYRIFMEDGRVLDVLADSAADAVALLQLTEGILRITNMELEGKRMLEGHVLKALDEMINTDISMDDARSGIGSILLPEAGKDHEKMDFETMDLVQYVGIKESNPLKDLPPLLLRPQETAAPEIQAHPAMIDDEITQPPAPAPQSDDAQHPETADALPPDETHAIAEPLPAEEAPAPEEPLSDETQAFLNEYLQNAENMDIVELDAPPEPEPETTDETPEPPAKELSPEEVRNLLSTKQDFS
jgi:hypothetical protein